MCTAFSFDSLVVFNFVFFYFYFVQYSEMNRFYGRRYRRLFCMSMYLMITRPSKNFQCEIFLSRYVQRLMNRFEITLVFYYFSVIDFIAESNINTFDHSLLEFDSIKISFLVDFYLICSLFSKYEKKIFILPHTPTPQLSHTVKIVLTSEGKNCLLSFLWVSRYD